MANNAKITCAVTITANSLTGVSVVNSFPNVIEMKFDYFMGNLQIRDAQLGVANFGLTELLTLVYTVAGSVTTVVIT